jgi:hypothetical protein
MSVDTPPLNDSKEQDAPYPMSFAHIVELIKTGQTIPGIRNIPPTILEGQGTTRAKPIRKKPWEKDNEVMLGNATTVVATSIMDEIDGE